MDEKNKKFQEFFIFACNGYQHMKTVIGEADIF